MTALLAVLLALALLIVLAYRGLSVLMAAPLAAALAAGLSGAPVMASLTQVMMPGMGGFVVQFLLLFLLGAIFGKLMEDTGATRSLAEAMVKRMGPANTSPTTTAHDATPPTKTPSISCSAQPHKLTRHGRRLWKTGMNG